MNGAGWLSYSLQDFIMFGPQVFLRLFVRINQDWWPWQLIAVLACLLVPFLMVSHKPRVRRLALGLISAGWIVSVYGFLAGYFGPINWPAELFGWAFVFQGDRSDQSDSLPKGQQRLVTQGLLFCWIAGVLALPSLPVAETGDWRALALFGVTPWTTAVVSMLAIAVLPSPWRWIYLVVPVLWSLFSAATFWVLQTTWLLALPVATLIFAGLGVWFSPSRAQTRG